MRRNDREITDKNEILKIMKRCEVCNIALFDEEFPYIIPLNFGVSIEEDTFVLYFHGAKVGHKLELIRKNPNAAFAMDCSHKLLLGEKTCNATMEYESVCGNGRIEILGEKETSIALTHLMNQYVPKEHHEFDEKELASVVVFKLTVKKISGKRLKRG